MHEDVKKNGKYVIARPRGQIENGKHAIYSDKKGIPEFLIFIPRHTKSGGVLCYTLRTLSVCPSVVGPSVLRFRTQTLVPFDQVG